jgi:hypothetical protein
MPASPRVRRRRRVDRASWLPATGTNPLATGASPDHLFDYGTGTQDGAEIRLCINRISSNEANEPVSTVDGNDNGRIDFASVVRHLNN